MRQETGEQCLTMRVNVKSRRARAIQACTCTARITCTCYASTEVFAMYYLQYCMVVVGVECERGRRVSPVVCSM